MKHLILILLFTCVSCAKPKQHMNILIAGDSITHHGHYVKELERMMPDSTFTSVSKIGAGTKECWMMMMKYLVHTNNTFDTLILFSGVNSTKRIPDTIAYNHAVTNFIGYSNVTAAYYLNIPPWGRYVSSDWTNKCNTESINISLNNTDVCIDISSYLLEADGTDHNMKPELTTDGLHPNRAGHKIIAEQIYRKLHPLRR